MANSNQTLRELKAAEVRAEQRDDDNRQVIPAADRLVLRALAEKLKEICDYGRNPANAAQWSRLNNLDQGIKPLVLVHLWDIAWGELLPDETTLKCTHERGRYYEKQMRQRLWMARHIPDDGVQEPVIRYPACLTLKEYKSVHWDISYSSSDFSQSGAGEFKPVILEKKDIDLLDEPVLHYDEDLRLRFRAEAEDIFGGILTPISDTVYFAGKVVDEFSWMRGMDKLFYDLIDDPAWVHEALQRITDNFIRRFQLVEETGLWGEWEKSNPLGSAGLRYLPEMDDWETTLTRGRLNTRDTWGFFTAEAFNNVSPGMHDEFAFTYDRQMAECFKYVNVGCCEVLHDKIEYIRTIPNARKIAVSEWADTKKAAEAIGRDYVYCYKPSGVPFILKEWQPEVVRKEISRALHDSEGCNVELILNIGGTPGENGAWKLQEWTRIANEEVDRYASEKK